MEKSHSILEVEIRKVRQLPSNSISFSHKISPHNPGKFVFNLYITKGDHHHTVITKYDLSSECLAHIHRSHPRAWERLIQNMYTRGRNLVRCLGNLPTTTRKERESWTCGVFAKTGLVLDNC